MVHIDDRYLRPLKAKHRRDMMNSDFPMRTDLEVWQGENATILPLRDLGEPSPLFGRSGVVDQDGQYVALSGIPGHVELDYPFENPGYVDAKVVYCGYLVPQWGHFLVEGAERLWYFLENDATVDKYVFTLEENAQREVKGNYRLFLELLGIWDKLEFVTQPTTYREVVVPELCYRCQKYYAPNHRALFQRIAENVVPKPEWETYEKIYFSRSQLKKQGNELDEFGYEALDEFFEKNGYLRLAPEAFPLDQLIYLIRNADTIATYSGSVAHNFYFARPGQTMEVLERCVVNLDFQTDLDRIMEVNGIYIDANLPLYTVDFGGPFIMGFNDNMQRFAADRGYLPPDEKFMTERYRRQCLAGYMRSYWNQYRYRWYMYDWYTTCADMMWEAYNAGYAYFREYLDGEKPFFWYQWLYPHYIKQALKRTLKKLGLYHG